MFIIFFFLDQSLSNVLTEMRTKNFLGLESGEFPTICL